LQCIAVLRSEKRLQDAYDDKAEKVCRPLVLNYINSICPVVSSDRFLSLLVRM